MTNTLKIHVLNGDKILTLVKEVDFIPSNELRIYHPIKGVVRFTYFENGYHGELDKVLVFGEKYQPMAMEHYFKNGFKILDEQEYEFIRLQYDIPIPKIITEELEIKELEHAL